MAGLPKWTKFESRGKKLSTVTATHVMEEFILGQLPLIKDSIVALI